PDLVEASTGINIWKEWAKIENAVLKNKTYEIGETTDFSAGLLIALSKEENPNYEDFKAPEIVKFLPIKHHIGMVLKSENEIVIQEHLDHISEEINNKFLSILPPKDKPTS
ncbi:MAG: ATPase, partial [Cruoricaptor ignavus]|nr:ATPase [Cruoricaptor ignavus]